jgi:predicted phosphate transport protein (TIGR00153 family)
MRLLPREEKFYQLFHQQAEIIAEASRLLLEAVRSGSSAREQAAREISVLEGKGDEIIHEIFTRLNQTFITPIDPEDIHELSSRLDDVLDGIEDTAHRLVMYHIDPVPQGMMDLAQIVSNCASSIVKAMTALEKAEPAMAFCIEINRQENEGDRIERTAVGTLFDTETNPILVIKLKEVYDFFENTIDSCEDVADALQSVIVKNS